MESYKAKIVLLVFIATGYSYTESNYIYSSIEQYTGYVVVPQYCFLIPSNFL